eukprot:TRINITY_DN40545_c0_g1_i1.p1 TRINITY_DN40545_c0_g1~~TRINITY_DN40545_c0_g1_i1.p1  ORF type:complete len:951 (-),score=122.73 TRINITY_DN40545_c0_g1_i1:278-3130(-)
MSEWHSFGRGVHGELGRMVVTDGIDAPGVQNADVRPLALPREDDGSERDLKSVYCGHFHCLGRTLAGRVWAWGANGEGQLGISGEQGDDVFVSAPTLALGTLIDDLNAHKPGERMICCAGGRSHSVFVSACGRVFAAGRLPTTEPGRQGAQQVEELREIDLVDGTGNGPQGRVITCHAGESHTLFVTDDGEVWSWLGDGGLRATRVGLERPTARAVLGLPKVTMVACGWHHTLALTDSMQVFSFGVGCFGQLGLGSCRHCPSPSHVNLPDECDWNVVNVAAGFASSFAVTVHGWVYAWGGNESCQLGLGTSIRGTATPKPVNALSQAKIVQVSAGLGHTAGITDKGLLYCWGSGSYGQLGFGYDDTKASVCLDGGGCAPFRSSDTNPGAPGLSTVGHSRHWIQVWPRRCTRGPFRGNRCFEVRCGAYHTIVRAQRCGDALSVATLSEPEVLGPAPLVLSDMPAASNVGADGSRRGHDLAAAELVLPPGAGLIESPKVVLRPGAGVVSRNTDTFRMLSDLFWTSGPSKGPSPAVAPKPPCPSTDDNFQWRRVLEETGAACKLATNAGGSNIDSPLKLRREKRAASKRRERFGESLQLPVDGAGVVGPTCWGTVDEAVHRTFCRGMSSPKVDLGTLLADASRDGAAGFSPELPDGEMRRGLPPAPCRGLARMECLTPRPFYLLPGETFGNHKEASLPQGVASAEMGDRDQQRMDPSEIANQISEPAASMAAEGDHVVTLEGQRATDATESHEKSAEEVQVISGQGDASAVDVAASGPGSAEVANDREFGSAMGSEAGGVGENRPNGGESRPSDQSHESVSPANEETEVTGVAAAEDAPTIETQDLGAFPAVVSEQDPLPFTNESLDAISVESAVIKQPVNQPTEPFTAPANAAAPEPTPVAPVGLVARSGEPVVIEQVTDKPTETTSEPIFVPVEAATAPSEPLAVDTKEEA